MSLHRALHAHAKHIAKSFIGPPPDEWLKEYLLHCLRHTRHIIAA